MGCLFQTQQKNTKYLDPVPYDPTAPYFQNPPNPYISKANSQQQDYNHGNKPSSFRKKQFCPLNHPLTKVKRLEVNLQGSCNNCKKQYQQKGPGPYVRFFICTQCKYQACSRCFLGSFSHEDICQNPQIKFGRYRDKLKSVARQCMFCGKNLTNFVTCQCCKTIACPKCMKVDKNNKCQHKFQFSQQKQLVCVYCQEKGIHYMDCRKCKIQMCEKCYKNELKNG